MPGNQIRQQQKLESPALGSFKHLSKFPHRFAFFMGPALGCRDLSYLPKRLPLERSCHSYKLTFSWDDFLNILSRQLGFIKVQQGEHQNRGQDWLSLKEPQLKVPFCHQCRSINEKRRS